MDDVCCGTDERNVVDPVEEDDACCGSGDDLSTRAIPPWWKDVALLPSTIAGVLLAAGLILGWVGLEMPSLAALWVALAAGAWTFVPDAVARLGRGKLGIAPLMTIAAIGAVLLGHVEEAAALAFLFSLAETLEDRAMRRAREGLRSLLSLIPETAKVFRGGHAESIPLAGVSVGDVLLVGAGERVATDGRVVEGSSSLDTSAITGESIPVEVSMDDDVLAGSVNGAGTLNIRVTADGRDNSLTQIVALVERANAQKGRRARLADRIARPLVPGVLVIAILVALFGILVGDPTTWLERALVVLVAASPCALAIAVPVTVISAIGSASRYGVVIKSGEAFEQFGTISNVAFDKTGTLTRNQPEVIAVHAAPGFDATEILRAAAAVEKSSSHPLATALVAASPGAPSATGVTEEAGSGVRGDVDGRHVQVGSIRWLDVGLMTDRADDMAGQGMTVMLVEIDGSPAGLIGVRDQLRPEAAETVRMLHDQGIRTAMLTGDNRRTADALASAAGIDDVRAEQLPGDKARAVTELVASGPTAMVGDGVNDAPALATATVGIAMGAHGSAAAIESADIAFTGHDLRLIPMALAHARRGRHIMVANIALALAIIVVLFPLALFGVLGLAGVVLVHEAAEVLVILNGLRAARRPAALMKAS